MYTQKPNIYTYMYVCTQKLERAQQPFKKSRSSRAATAATAATEGYIQKLNICMYVCVHTETRTSAAAP